MTTTHKNMKTIEIESTIAIYYPETVLAYAQIINTAVNCCTKSDLREGLEQLKTDTDAHDFFDWGFGKNHFWLYHKKNKIKSDIELININD